MYPSTEVMIARGEIDREELRYDPFFQNIIPYVSDVVLIDLTKDIYHAIEENGGPNWSIIGAYQACKKELEHRGYRLSVERTGQEWQVIVAGPESKIPF